MWRWLILAVVIFLGWHQWGQRERHHSAGMIAAEEPRQRALDRTPVLHKAGYTIEPLERFDIEARVLSATTYRFDREADLAPVDLALGWGPMSDTAVIDKVDISQSGRFYFWHVDEFPIPRREIETHSANMHMIPANEAVENKLRKIARGQVVSLSGYLVAVSAPDGWRWQSSLTREDTGNGACELIWVEDLSVR